MLPSRFFRRLISEQRRFKSSILNWQLKSIVNTNDTLELTVKDEKSSSSRSLLVPFAWLRDHCNTHNYHAATNQRKNSMLNISIEAQIENASTSSPQDDVLSIRWKDGKISKFSIDDILSNSLNRNAQSSIGRRNSLVEPWDNSTLKEIPQMRQSSVSLNSFCLNFLRYGLVIVNEVEATAQKTEELCKSILAIQDTFFGEFWVFSNESKDNEEEEYHEDTAYGNEEIGPHVDGTYFQNGLGIQVFHCLHPANRGGETVLIDGYKGAEILKEQYPEDYDILTKYKIDHQYIENGGNVQLHAVSSGNPVIQLDQHGNIAQIRYNPYDRAPMKVLSDSEESAKDTILFYRAYERFAQILSEPRMAINIQLQPGQVIFIDNTRVLHSRTSFSGYRQMCGCYMSRDDLLAKARPFLDEDIRRFV